MASNADCPLGFGLSDEDWMSLLHLEPGRPWPWFSFGTFGIWITMRVFVSLAVCGLALLCGCRSEHYTQGHGDAGQFILQHAIDYGGHPVTTNGLPAIGGDWQYVQDEFGVGLLLPVSQYQPVEDFLRAAFGPPSNSAGWSVRDFGVAIMVQKESSNTVIGVYPPMSDEKMARAARQMTETIQKNTR